MTAYARIGFWWRALPFDGQGWRRSSDPLLADLRSWASQCHRAGRLPKAIRLPATLLLRLLWAAAAVRHAWVFARPRRMSCRALWRVYADCVSSGARPVEAFAWRACRQSTHPLPGRAAGILLKLLGNRRDTTLLGDKAAACAAFTAAGIPTTVIHAVLPRGSTTVPATLPQDRALFLKPRHGSAGRGTIELLPHATHGLQFAIDVARLAQRDDILVQDRLEAHADHADLSMAGRSPVLRLTTARMPQGRPFLYSALLNIPVPGERPRNFLRGELRAPVHPVMGMLIAAYRFDTPGRRYDFAPWNDAVITGRKLNGFDEATDIALQAMALVPETPLVSWDVILSNHGAVLLEGNVGGDFILTELPRIAFEATPPPLLATILAAWQDGFRPGLPASDEAGV